MHTIEIVTRREESGPPVARNLYPIYARQGRSPKSYKAGFIDAGGRVVIEPTFEDAQPFHEGLASVQMNQRWGAIDSGGNLVIPCIHSSTGLTFKEGVSEYADGTRRGLIAADGTVILHADKYWAISDFQRGYGICVGWKAVRIYQSAGGNGHPPVF